MGTDALFVGTLDLAEQGKRVLVEAQAQAHMAETHAQASERPVDGRKPGLTVIFAPGYVRRSGWRIVVLCLHHRLLVRSSARSARVLVGFEDGFVLFALWLAVGIEAPLAGDLSF